MSDFTNKENYYIYRAALEYKITETLPSFRAEGREILNFRRGRGKEKLVIPAFKDGSFWRWTETGRAHIRAIAAMFETEALKDMELSAISKAAREHNINGRIVI